jgi:hypothetical protein
MSNTFNGDGAGKIDVQSLWISSVNNSRVARANPLKMRFSSCTLTNGLATVVSCNC